MTSEASLDFSDGQTSDQYHRRKMFELLRNSISSHPTDQLDNSTSAFVDPDDRKISTLLSEASTRLLMEKLTESDTMTERDRDE